MSEPKDSRGYPCNPRMLTDDAWFYEEPEGLTVVQRGGPNTRTCYITWRKLCAAVDRHRRNKAKKSTR